MTAVYHIKIRYPYVHKISEKPKADEGTEDEKDVTIVKSKCTTEPFRQVVHKEQATREKDGMELK